MKFLLTCDPGLEDVVEKELKENFKRIRVAQKFLGLRGNVLLEMKDSYKKLLKLHSIHHITRLLHTFKIEKSKMGLNEIYRVMKRLRIPKLKYARSFRVTSERVGTHEFTSLEIQRVAGKALVERFKKKVDLKNFELNVRVDVIDTLCLVGLQLTDQPLYKRFSRAFDHPAGIKATLAYGMLRLAELKAGDTLLDPMCGSGTIPIEAALVYGARIKIVAGDKNEKFVEGSMLNAKRASVKLKFVWLDARKLERHFKIGSIDKIITNPPYGIRVGDKHNLRQLYKQFARSAYSVLREGGKLVVITPRANSLRAFALKRGFRLCEERVVEHGGLFPHILVLKKS